MAQPITTPTAMVLAAGLGTRMRPITDTLPKPLVTVGGKALIDWGLDALAGAGVATAVVNVHHLAGKLEAHLAARAHPSVIVSDEREKLLDSAGGIVKALPLFGEKPFLLLNADTFWLDRRESNLCRLLDSFDEATTDIFLLLADPAHATGHTGRSDFLMDAEARLSRARGAADGLIYAVAAVIHPRIFAGVQIHPHSLNLYFDRAIGEGRLRGCKLEGHWITVGTPDAIRPAEEAIRRAREVAQA